MPGALNLLIVGGSGFVSGTLARMAVEAGHKVWVVTRGQKPLPPGVNSIVCDRSERSLFEDAIAAQGMEWDLVVDCIGYQPEDAQQDVEVFASRASHLVFISTDFVYDPAQRRFPQPEDDADYIGDGYGGNKRLCELELSKADRGAMSWTVLRPCHIYGPGSQLGCLPMHGRDTELIAKLKAGSPLQLVGGGYFLQQPIFVRDLAATILSCAGNSQAHGSTFNVAGPDIVESRTYYRYIAEELGVELAIDEVPVDEYRMAHPESKPFLCHRIYDLSRLQAAGLSVPSTALKQGLREHVASFRPHYS